MAKVTQFDRVTCREVESKAIEALRDVAQELGLSVTPRSGSFNSKNYFFKVEFAVVGHNGEVFNKDAEEFKQYGSLMGLPPIGSEILFDGNTYRVTGLRMRSRRFPVLVDRVSDGKTFKLTAEMVKEGYKKLNPSFKAGK